MQVLVFHGRDSGLSSPAAPSRLVLQDDMTRPDNAESPRKLATAESGLRLVLQDQLNGVSFRRRTRVSRLVLQDFLLSGRAPVVSHDCFLYSPDGSFGTLWSSPDALCATDADTPRVRHRTRDCLCANGGRRLGGVDVGIRVSNRPPANCGGLSHRGQADNGEDRG